MKKRYTKPDIALVRLDTCSLCTSSTDVKWQVDSPSEGDTVDMGPINQDYGKGTFEDDPFDPDNW